MAGVSFEQAERYVLNKSLKPTSKSQSYFAPVCAISRNPKRQNPNPKEGPELKMEKLG